MGVDHRILQLSDRDESSAAMPESGRPYESLMPLPGGDLRMCGIFHGKQKSSGTVRGAA